MGPFREFVGRLDQHAGAVAGRLVGTRGTTMSQVTEDFRGFFENAVICGLPQVGDEPDTAGIVLEGGIV